MAKLVFGYSVQIDAKQEDVFNYISDFVRHSEWNEGLRMEAVSDGPIAVGSLYRSIGKLMGKDVTNDIRITEYEPHSRLAFVSNDGKADFSQEMYFSPNNGGTLLERKLTFDASALMALLFRLLIGPLVANRSMNKSLKNLKAKVESGAS